MNIVVIGAGEVGTHIATVLSAAKRNVVVIDSDPNRIRRIEETLDVQAVEGYGTDVTVLEQAGAGNADLVLAVSNSDEVNLVAAHLAKGLGARKTIVRARKRFYLEERLRHFVEAFNADRIVCAEVLAAQEIAKRLEHPGTLKLEYFAHGRIQMRSFYAEEGAPQVGVPLRDIPFPGRTLIAGISRNERFLIPGGSDKVEAGDGLTVLGSTADISRIESLFRRERERPRRVVVVGGSLIGFYLAQILERRGFSVVLVERNLAHCEVLAEQFQRTEVVNGDATNIQFLRENRYTNADAFAATTNIDETNLVSALLMRSMGVPIVGVVMHRPDFASLLEGVGVTFAVSPRFTVANTVLNMLQHQNVLSVSVLDKGQAELVELRAEPGAPMSGRSLRDARLPKGCLVALVVRGGEVFIPKGDDRIEAGDSVIVLAPVDVVPRVEKSFRTQ